MGMRGRLLQPGDEALTDFNGNGMTQVKIVSRVDNSKSQSGVMFQVKPSLKNNLPDAWIDSEWFEPVSA